MGLPVQIWGEGDAATWPGEETMKRPTVFYGAGAIQTAVRKRFGSLASLGALAWVLAMPAAQAREVIVVPGDTLEAIAHTYGVSLETLIQANGIQDPSRLQIGQKLLLPKPALGGSSRDQPASRVSPATTITSLAWAAGIASTKAKAASVANEPNLLRTAVWIAPAP